VKDAHRASKPSMCTASVAGEHISGKVPEMSVFAASRGTHECGVPAWAQAGTLEVGKVCPPITGIRAPDTRERTGLLCCSPGSECREDGEDPSDDHTADTRAPISPRLSNRIV